MKPILYGLLWLIATVTTGASSPAFAIDIPQYQHDLASLLPDSRYTTIKIGKQSAPVFTHDANTQATKGVAILLSDMNKRPDYALFKLSQTLNDMGWFTIISVTPDFENVSRLPPEQEINDSKGTDIFRTVSQDQYVDQTLFKQSQTRFAEYVKELTRQARQQPGFTLIIASGTAAAGIANLYAHKEVKPADGLVTLQPYWPDAPLNQQLPDDLAKSNTAVLDIVNQQDNRWSQATVKARRVAARKAFKVHYRQSNMTADQSPDQSPYLAKEISGWTSSMGW